MKKKIIALTLGICIIAPLTSCGDGEDKDVSAKVQEINLEIKEELEEYKNFEEMSKEDKEELGEKLFELYVNENKIEKRLNGEEIVTFKDYRITKIKLLENIQDELVIEVFYDIQMTEETNYWAAGVGEIEEDGWVTGKYMIRKITIENGKFNITVINEG